MSLCIIKDCNEETAEKRPESGGSVSVSQLYCTTHLEEEIKSGRLNPIHAPIPG